MTPSHLSPREFVEAADRTLPSDRLDHLDVCSSCRHEVADLRHLAEDAAWAGVVPEPSPFFWEHLRRRVRASTVDQPRVEPHAWWTGAWRLLAALAAVSAAVVLVLMFRPAPAAPVLAPVLPASTSARTGAGSVAPADDVSAGLIADLASDLPADELQQVTRPTRNAAAAVMDQLTPEQCELMVRLIKAQMNGTE
jgi:hypothetical protein